MDESRMTYIALVHMPDLNTFLQCALSRIFIIIHIVCWRTFEDDRQIWLHHLSGDLRPSCPHFFLSCQCAYHIIRQIHILQLHHRFNDCKTSDSVVKGFPGNHMISVIMMKSHIRYHWITRLNAKEIHHFLTTGASHINPEIFHMDFTAFLFFRRHEVRGLRDHYPLNIFPFSVLDDHAVCRYICGDPSSKRNNA